MYKYVWKHNNKTSININNPNIKKIIPNIIPVHRKRNIKCDSWDQAVVLNPHILGVLGLSAP